MFKRIVPWIPALSWAALIFTVSSLPNLKATQNNLLQELINTVAHFIEYFIFTVLILYAIRNTRSFPRRELVAAGAIALLYSLFDEIHQYFVPTRMADVRDILVDSVGILSCLLLVKWGRGRNK